MQVTATRQIGLRLTVNQVISQVSSIIRVICISRNHRSGHNNYFSQERNSNSRETQQPDNQANDYGNNLDFRSSEIQRPPQNYHNQPNQHQQAAPVQYPSHQAENFGRREKGQRCIKTKRNTANYLGPGSNYAPYPQGQDYSRPSVYYANQQGMVDNQQQLANYHHQQQRGQYHPKGQHQQQRQQQLTHSQHTSLNDNYQHQQQWFEWWSMAAQPFSAVRATEQ